MPSGDTVPMARGNLARRICAAGSPHARARRRRGLALLASIASIASIVSGAEAASRTTLTCRSGTTVFRQGAVRAFFVKHHLSSQPSLTWRSYYACRPGASKPKLIYESSPATYTHVYGFRMFGARLGFVVTSEGYAGGGEALVAWLDTESGQLRIGTINVNEEQYTPASAPGVPIGHVSFAIAPDGAVAVLGEDGPEQEIALLRLGHVKLKPPVRLFYTQAGTVAPGSLTISETAVGWSTRTGQAESAPA